MRLSYTMWCEVEGRKPLGATRFRIQLLANFKDVVFDRKRFGGTRGFMGIKPKPDATNS